MRGPQKLQRKHGARPYLRTGRRCLYLSKRFREVITLERDATLAAVAEENFRRLGATNIRVINSSAEAFLA